MGGFDVDLDTSTPVISEMGGLDVDLGTSTPVISEMGGLDVDLGTSTPVISEMTGVDARRAFAGGIAPKRERPKEDLGALEIRGGAYSQSKRATLLFAWPSGLEDRWGQDASSRVLGDSVRDDRSLPVA